MLLEGIKKEWTHYASEIESKNLVSIYIGGGTPSLLHPEEISRLLEPFSKNTIEITIEANPDSIDYDKLKSFRSIGINRISIGVQTFSPNVLLPIQREHSSEQATRSIYLAKEAGFDNISIDLMYDLPQQTLVDWESSLQHASTLPITHLSLYNLVIEEHTVFYKHKNKIQKQQASEEDSKKMYQMAREHFSTIGWEQYEVSAFCLPGQRSYHNSGYWTGRPFIGLGPSAYSFWKEKRYRNVPRLHLYSKLLHSGHLPLDDKDSLSKEERIRELLCIHLRLTEGIPLQKVPPLKEIPSLIEEGLLEKTEHTLRLTEKGLFFYDSVASTLI